MIKKLLVDPPGDTIFMNKAVFLDLRSSESAEKNVTVNIPKTAVKGSERIFISTAAGQFQIKLIINFIQISVKIIRSSFF